VKPHEHKILLEVYDENRITRDDFLGLYELNLHNLVTDTSRHNQQRSYMLQPRR